MSATIVHSFDKLGSLLFAIVLNSFIHHIINNCKLLLHARYLDDETIIGNSEKVTKTLDIIQKMGLE